VKSKTGMEVPKAGGRLTPFILEETEREERNDMSPLLDPMAFRKLRKEPVSISQEVSRKMRVNIVGIPNSGKSTLINALVGSHVCPTASKVQTTIKNSLAVLTEEDTQIIFQDTPGIVTRDEIKKFNLSDEIVQGARDSCLDTDLICVIHDVSNRYVREAISKRVLDLLIRNPTIPSILVLNKMDTVPHSQKMYELIRKLTCGQLEGQRQVIKTDYGKERPISVDGYFKKRQKKQDKLHLKKGEQADSNGNEYSVGHQTDKIKIRSYDDLMRVIQSDTSGYDMDEMVEDLSMGLAGWPGFRDVFTVSALFESGVKDLKEYLLYNAKPSQDGERYHEDLPTLEDPRDLVLSIARAKLLEILYGERAYRTKIKISSWVVDNGCLRLQLTVESHKRTTSKYLLQKRAAVELARLIEKDCQNLFHCEVFCFIIVDMKHAPLPVKTSEHAALS